MYLWKMPKCEDERNNPEINIHIVITGSLLIVKNCKKAILLIASISLSCITKIKLPLSTYYPSNHINLVQIKNPLFNNHYWHLHVLSTYIWK